MKQIIDNNNKYLLSKLIPSRSEPIIGMITDPKDLAFERTLKENGL